MIGKRRTAPFAKIPVKEISTGPEVTDCLMSYERSMSL